MASKYVLRIGGRDGIRADQMHEYVKKILVDENIPFIELVSDDNTEEFPDLYQDCLYQEAKTLVVLGKFKSAAMLQRKLRIGYPRAAMLMDMLEHNGVVKRLDGPGEWKLNGWYATEEAKEEYKKPIEKRIKDLIDQTRSKEDQVN